MPDEMMNRLAKVWRGQDQRSVAEVFRNDRAALGVIAALIMTVNFGALQNGVPAGDHPALAAAVFVLTNAVGGTVALGCVWIGAYQYLKINMLPAEQIQEYVNGLRFHEEPVHWMTVAVVALPLSLMADLYLRYDGAVFIAVASTVAVVFLMAVRVVVRSISTTRRWLSQVETGDASPTSADPPPTRRS